MKDSPFSGQLMGHVKECPGAQENCREDLLDRISKRITLKGLMLWLCAPLSILGTIVILLTLLMNASLNTVNASIVAVDNKVNKSGQRNDQQDERLRSLELRQTEVVTNMRAITENVAALAKLIDKLEKK